MAADLLLGKFTCAVTFEIVRPPKPVRQEKNGITYVVQGDYELAFQTVLHFASGAELPIKARLFGDLSQKVVIRDSAGRPTQMGGYTQGRSEIADADGNVIFEGLYYDSRTLQPLAGDDALTPVGTFICDHWENGFGRGAFAGHAFSLGIPMTRKEGDARLSGQAKGQID
jgi:hypothetical protein